MSDDDVEAHLLDDDELLDFAYPMTWNQIVLAEGIVTALVEACDPDVVALRRARMQLVARERVFRDEASNAKLANAFEFAARCVATHERRRAS